ncbi:hypothetical protein OCF10_21260 [Bacillus cereus]|uniref:hypothetical protein n=1 Tax=Bacillus TaxID=1386 RepID=UPI001F58A09E|nr:MULTISPECIES: hypothetical protein [Bacillus cereus group]MCU4991439.1 hypothetical protein [Bacillus cereus]USL13885.1 hypothetical protein LIT28_01095 [Bacillus thuringiensis]
MTIVFFAFLSLTQMVLTVFGNAGMIFNIISLSLQLVSSGVIVPHEMLSKTYQTIGELFPATYAANGYYTIIFGGVSLEKNIIALLVIILVTQSIAVITLLFCNFCPLVVKLTAEVSCYKSFNKSAL